MPTLYLLLAAIGGPILVGGLTYGVEELRTNWAVDAAVKAQSARDERLCNARVAEIAVATSTDALAKVDADESARRAMVPTPDTREGIKALCAKETACRKP